MCRLDSLGLTAIDLGSCNCDFVGEFEEFGGCERVDLVEHGGLVLERDVGLGSSSGSGNASCGEDEGGELHFQKVFEEEAAELLRL